MKEDSLKSAPAEGPRWPRSRLSGDDISKAIKEMTAVRQGQTDRDSSLSPSFFNMFFFSLPSVMAIDFKQANKKYSSPNGGQFNVQKKQTEKGLRKFYKGYVNFKKGGRADGAVVI